MSKYLGNVSAYAYAVEHGGYTGTEEEYGREMADLANISAEAETLSPDEEASASYSGGVLSFGVPQGVTGNGIASAVLNPDFTLTLTFTDGTTYTTPTPIRGERGATGNGIASIAKTGTIGLVDTYTITYTDGTTMSFTVTNGTAAIDNTLSIAGRAADAKATGDGLRDVENSLDNKTNWTTPEQYGAVGDGVTDDGLAISSAITAAGIGGRIMLGEKTYYVGSSLFTLLEGQTLTGGGVLYQSSEVSGNLITTDDGVVIDGITIKQDNYHTGRGILVSGDNVAVRNCNIIGKQIGIHGDDVYGDNLLIEANRISFTMYGVYVSVAQTERRRTGLRVVNNVITLAEGYDATLSASLNKALNIGGCSGAVVHGNTLLGAAMDFCSYLWADHIVYSNNVSDNYVSVIGDYCVVSNNIIDGSLTPEIHYPVSSAGMFCAIEIVGNECIVDGNIIKNNKGPAVSSNGSNTSLMKSGLIISNNLIESCATDSQSMAALNLVSVGDIKITNNFVYNCGNANKAHSAIYVQGYPRRPVPNINIINNTLKYCKNTNDRGAVKILHATDVKIVSNIIDSTGMCLELATDGQLVTKCVVENNTFISTAINRVAVNDGYYVNEYTLRSNNLVRAVNGYNTYNISRNSKNYNNDGLVAGTPTRGTFNVGELYPTSSALKRCTAAGTLGITTFSVTYNGSVTASTTEGSAEITVNRIGGVFLCEGQYIDVEGAVSGAKILMINRTVNELGFIESATITLSMTASASVTDVVVTYHSPSFADIT